MILTLALSYQTHFKVVNPMFDLVEIGNISFTSANLVWSTLLQRVTEHVHYLKTHDNVHQEVSCKSRNSKDYQINNGTHRSFLATERRYKSLSYSNYMYM